MSIDEVVMMIMGLIGVGSVIIVIGGFFIIMTLFENFEVIERLCVDCSLLFGVVIERLPPLNATISDWPVIIREFRISIFLRFLTI